MATKRAIAVLLGALWLLVAGASPSFAAQNRPGTATLTGVKLISESPIESRFQLDFSPSAPGYTPAFGPPNQPGVGLAATLRGPRAVQPASMTGLVRALEFRQEDSILIVRFQTTASSATIAANRNSDTSLEVIVTSADARRGGGSDTADAGSAGVPPPPPAYSSMPGQDGFELVMLKYADVSEIVGLLTEGVTVKSNDVFVPKEPAFGSNSLTGNQYNPAPSPPQPGESDDPLGQSVDQSMAIDRRLNAIWLKGPPDRIARMKAMIAMIDIPVDSVMLETQMVELTEQGQRAIGIDFANANGQLGLFTLHSGEAILPGISQGCDFNGNCSGHVTSAAFQAAIYAQVQKGNGRIVSRPRIATLSGVPAKIITGDALPILTAITLSGVNGVSQQVQYVNVGVTLQIAPRVSGDGFVTSHVYAVVSSVTGFSQGYPTISQRQAETAATVRDGDTFVIGGLTQDEAINTKTRVPILGDIPIIGQAFRTDRNQRTKTELYIIVTPRVVHRVGSTALTTSRKEPYPSRPVVTVPSDEATPSQPYYVPLTPVPPTAVPTTAVPPAPPPPRQ